MLISCTTIITSPPSLLHHLLGYLTWSGTLCRYGTSSGGVGGAATSVTGSGGISVNSGSGANNGVGTGGNSTQSVASSVAAQFGNSFGGGSTASKLAAVVAAQNNATPISSSTFDRYVFLCGVDCDRCNPCPVLMYHFSHALYLVTLCFKDYWWT